MWWLLTSLEAGNWIRWVWDLPWPSEGFPDPCLGTSKMGYWSLMVSHWSFWYWSFRGILILIKMDGMRIAINDSSMTQRPSLVCNSYSSMISEDRPVFLRQLGGSRFFQMFHLRDDQPESTWLVGSSPLCLLVDLLICPLFSKTTKVISEDCIRPYRTCNFYAYLLLFI